MKEVLNKLLNIQQELKVPKNKEALGGRYSFRNTDDILKTVKPLLQKNKCIITLSDEVLHFKDEGVYISSSIDNKGEPVKVKKSLSRYYVKTTVILYCIESGNSITVNAVSRESREKKGMDAAQLTGSSSSYSRKYALSGLFALDDEKDLDEK